MKRYLLVISIFSISLIIGCIANLKDIPRETCTSAPSDKVMKAITENCIKCHAKDFSNSDDVCKLKGIIQESVRTKKMPKIGTLWPEYYQTFMDWK